jgi:hypothetical protein
MGMTNAERQRRYIQRLKAAAVSNAEPEEETNERIKVLEKELKKRRGYPRENERLKRKLANAAPPDIHNGMTVPERIHGHLRAAFQLIEMDLEVSGKRQKGRANRVLNAVHYAFTEFTKIPARAIVKPAKGKPAPTASGGAPPMRP